MEQKYLIDTNVIIDLFGNKLPESGKIFLFSIDINHSAVTKIEVLGWLNATEHQLKPLNAFMKMATILPINETVINQTIKIRQTKKIGLGDAIIAATALAHNFTIITNNEKDFKNIDGLKVINPHKI